MIKIGVSSCFFYPDPGRAYFAPKTLCFLENDLANYLTQKEVLPVLIPDLEEVRLHEFLDKMDGIVFQGGADLCPETYGAAYLNQQRWPGDLVRDQYELKIADFAFKHALPMLGICRGAQLLNVYFGGSLYQDIAMQFPTTQIHRSIKEYDHIYHAVEWTKQGRLSTLYGDIAMPYVNTVHHQGIDRLGEGLVVEARCSNDQLIEAFSYQDMNDKYILGVQWHPEFSHVLGDKLIPADRIYFDFINHIKQRIK